MNRTKIEWCDYTWNPVVGCKRGCFYCYARKMNKRFKWIPDFAKPQFFKNRLLQPGKIKKPSKIFVGSMTDICFWDRRWIEDVLDVCKKYYHSFMFLTKDSFVYSSMAFPENCMLGLTLTCKEDPFVMEMRMISLECKDNKTFISFEPLLGRLEHTPETDLVIVGAMTGPGAIKPKPEWIQSIKDNVPEDKIFWKNNIKKYLKD